MKKLLLAICSLSLVISAHAQVKTPQPSTSSKLEQTIGMTDVSVTYSDLVSKDVRFLVISYPLIKLGVLELIKIPFLLFNTMLE